MALDKKTRFHVPQQGSENAFDDAFFQHNLPQYYRAILSDFRKITHGFITFNILFLCAVAIETTLFFSFLPLLSRSAGFILAFGGVFLTCVSYFLLLFYYQTRKPEQISALKERFVSSCRQMLNSTEGVASHHLSLAEALSKLAAYLHEFEWNFYKVPKLLSPLAKSISRFSAYCYGEDVFRLKQLLLHAAVEEHLTQIRFTPTDLEVHASLAGTYVSLSKVYKGSLYEGKHKEATRLAMEEFSILSHYAPNDPWVHEQLAVGYRELGLADAETKEVETLSKLRPQDKEVLYRLGSLYFKQGLNAKGLQTYEELKRANFKKADDLISSYGTILE